jgi:hypothetical protein
MHFVKLTFTQLDCRCHQYRLLAPGLKCYLMLVLNDQHDEDEDDEDGFGDRDDY